jgi:FAD dependent oxidoreductase
MSSHSKKPPAGNVLAVARPREVDWAVIGAGIFGLFATLKLLQRGLRVAVIDREGRPLLRASLVNQARLHAGYHYPRSIFTAFKSASYGERFAQDFPQAVNRSFLKIYAIARLGSITDADAFVRFCSHVGIPLRQIDSRPWLLPESVTTAWETREYTFDAAVVRASLLERIHKAGSPEWLMNTGVTGAAIDNQAVVLELSTGETLRAHGVVNATYAGTNALPKMLGFESLPLKYELTEVVLVKTSGQLEGVGVTVLDGPFFSAMPFGLTGRHSLTSVSHTPRRTSAALLPTFACQERNRECTPELLANCSTCPARPSSAWPLMERRTRCFLRPDIELRYEESLFTVKTVLRSSEVDDARPTVIVRHSVQPPILTILSGKASTIYDVEEVL